MTLTVSSPKNSPSYYGSHYGCIRYFQSSNLSCQVGLSFHFLFEEAKSGGQGRPGQ